MEHNEILRMMQGHTHNYPFKTDKGGMTTWHHSFVESIAKITVGKEIVYER